MNMKKFFRIAAVSAALLCSAFITCGAQSLWIGPKADFAGSWITHTVLNPGDKVLPHNGFQAGLMASYDFGEDMMVQAELLYATRGHSDRNTITDLKYSRNIGYLEIPLFFGYKLDEEKFHIMIGPELAWALHCTTKEQVFVGDKMQELKNDKSIADCNPFNISLALQFAYYFIPNLGVDLKLDFGLNRTFNKEFAYKDKVPDNGHNLGVCLGLVYRFEL